MPHNKLYSLASLLQYLDVRIFAARMLFAVMRCNSILWYLIIKVVISLTVLYDIILLHNYVHNKIILHIFVHVKYFSHKCATILKEYTIC